MYKFWSIFWIVTSLSFCLFVFILYCKKEEREEQGMVCAVWKHEVDRYSVTVQEGNSFIDKGFYNSSAKCTFKLIADVPENSNMWYKADYSCNELTGGGYGNVEIHIHNIKDINGSGWNHGKFGSGMLEKVD